MQRWPSPLAGHFVGQTSGRQDFPHPTTVLFSAKYIHLLCFQRSHLFAIRWVDRRLKATVSQYRCILNCGPNLFAPSTMGEQSESQ